MSVDVLTTTKGMPTSGGINIQELTLEVVVSCDIIEYLLIDIYNLSPNIYNVRAFYFMKTYKTYNPIISF